MQPSQTPSKAAALFLPEEVLLGRIYLLFFTTNTLQSAALSKDILVSWFLEALGKCFLSHCL